MQFSIRLTIYSMLKLTSILACGFRSVFFYIKLLEHVYKTIHQNFYYTYFIQNTYSWIYSTLPEDKQMLALSATYPKSLGDNLDHYMRSPMHVKIDPKDVSLLGLSNLILFFSLIMVLFAVK